jgi:hypothetical protein
MTDQTSLTVQAVVDRFNSSERTLQELGEKLRALTLAEETAADGAKTIREAASALTQVAGDLRSLASRAAVAQTEVRRAVEAAKGFLEGTDVSALHRTLDGLTESTGAITDAVGVVRERQQASDDANGKRFEALEQRLVALEESRHETAKLQQQLDKVRAGLSARKLRQLGLDA